MDGTYTREELRNKEGTSRKKAKEEERKKKAEAMKVTFYYILF